MLLRDLQDPIKLGALCRGRLLTCRFRGKKEPFTEAEAGRTANRGKEDVSIRPMRGSFFRLVNMVTKK